MVPSIEDLTGDFDVISTGLARAQDTAAAAHTAAEQIGSRAAASGFAGIAQNMARVRDAVQEMGESVGALVKTSAETRAQVAAAPKQLSPQETIGALTPVAHRLDEVRQGTSVSIELVNRTRQLVGAALQGGQPGPMLARLDAIRQTLVAVAERVTTAKQHVEAVIARVGQVGDEGKPTTGAGVPDQGSPVPGPAQWIRDGARRLPPRPGGVGPTHGLAFDTTTGTPLTDQPYRSGHNIASTADLRPLPALKGFPWTLTDHIEARVAQEMRQSGAPRDVSLVLNNEPCTDDPYGCDRMLRHVIPAGSRLTIYVTDPDAPGGARLFRRYDGTGKGIKP
ncbi:hypothetical protein Vau01_105920 [Virgisporangium aurantiacum]|uniref:Nucleic acid/nucleotide deaminase of polymorphic system toxin n=1 Tax=Virgisporangium aurantiacum TaxID=175570 RepID=A0A8J3ZFS6_9ACTN|nr:hypothetical protein Vau01_105920 [Virgisporangium aurantiacum]